MNALLLLNLAVGWYNVGTIWAHEVDIFRSWRLVGTNFGAVQLAHWRKLPYWVLAPAGAALVGAVALAVDHPAGVATWAIDGALAAQALSAGLTGLLWGRWQAALSRDPRGADSPYLGRILATHWLRTALVTTSALLLLVCALLTP
jgi:hypothetical protein